METNILGDMVGSTRVRPDHSTGVVRVCQKGFKDSGNMRTKILSDVTKFNTLDRTQSSVSGEH